MVERAQRCRYGLPAAGLAAVALLVAVDGEAHDYWLDQERLALEVGDTCSIRLLVGDRLEPELERPLQKEITTRYEWLTGNTSLDLLAVLPDSAQPVFKRPIESEGTSLLVMDRDFVVIESTYEQFGSFLEHEEKGVIAGRVKDISGDTKLRRRYARNLKALIRVGAGDEEGLYGREVGQKLEILLLQDPQVTKRGEELSIQVLFAGEPLEGELVRVFVGDGEGLTAELKARCNAKGLASFKVEHEGLWVIRVTHLRRSDRSEEADWDTYYATFSFLYP